MPDPRQFLWHKSLWKHAYIYEWKICREIVLPDHWKESLWKLQKKFSNRFNLFGVGYISRGDNGWTLTQQKYAITQDASDYVQTN